MRSTIMALLVPSLLAAQSAGRVTAITPAEIDGHLRFLSSDLLEGRAPATRGGQLAAGYLASQLRAFGLRPGLDTSYLQTVPIDVVTADRSTMKIAASDKASAMLRHPEDVVVWAGSATPSSNARGQLVFVGYGATAPEYRWDDFKDVDVRGKILLVLVNDPPAPASEPRMFGGRAMTYYGRWPYKFEEAERRGAAGALIVHTTDAAGYPWHTVVGSWASGQRMLPRPSDAPPPLGFRGWIQDSAATALLKQAGLDLGELRERATRRDFRPVATGITLDVGFRNSVENLKSENVVGVVRGSDPKLRDDYVVFTAHWDHFGIGTPVDGDSIYNGTLDNASGTADLLAVARAAASGAPPRRSLMFVFVTGEESGLLGSKYYAEHPTVPVERIVANLNVDGGNLLGRTRDLRVLGDTKSSLGPSLATFVRPRGMRLSPEEHPERGYFYRSDHFSFAKVGVPAVSIGAGYDFVGRPKTWGVEQEEDYTAHRYHQPSDSYRPDFDLTGAVQLSDIVLEFGRWIANAATVPTWNADAEFRALRKPITE
ncbi:MAG TPA: M28 family peptidase [Gemmatimonadaceae bacterium]|nr:M28 family peptidase [Gemmatimonadaceae bacterium]